MHAGQARDEAKRVVAQEMQKICEQVVTTACPSIDRKLLHLRLLHRSTLLDDVDMMIGRCIEKRRIRDEYRTGDKKIEGRWKNMMTGATNPVLTINHYYYVLRYYLRVRVLLVK